MTETVGSSVAVAPRVAVAVDAVVVAGYAVVAGGALLSGAVGGAWRVLLAAPLVGFLPGYALLSALVPADGGDDRLLTTERLRSPGLAWLERCSLSVATSVATLPLVALGLSAVGAGLSAGPATAALVGFVVVATAVGVRRRLRLSPEDRYAPPLARWRREVQAAFDGSRVDAAVNLLVVVAVVVAMSGLAYGLAAPPRGESYTETALLTEEGGDLVAGNYTTAAVQGERVNVTLSVENREGRPMEYTAVVVLERVRSVGGDAAVVERNELERASLAVPDGERRTRALSPEPEMLGDDLRLSVLLFEGEAPGTATPAGADERLHLWIDVSERANATAVDPPVGPAGSA
jgi:uncharacterized membrane protein